MTRQEKKKIADPKIVTDAVDVAEEAGLRYVSHDQPGYTRKAKGDDFEYFDTEGKPIRDEQRLLRIKRLAIPPAYTDVWICPSANGHIQATGRDARGRKQYRYHKRWRAARDENKYDRIYHRRFEMQTRRSARERGSRSPRQRSGDPEVFAGEAG
jgi:DNA topoisomerase-1